MILMAAIAALGVMAVSASAASANVTFKAGGVELPSGAPITAEGTNLETKTEFGFGPTLTCGNVFVEGEVGVNNAEPATLVNGLGEGEGCEAAGTPVVVDEVELVIDEFFANGTDNAHFRFHYLLGGVQPCEFTGENIKTTWSSNGTIHIVTPNALVGSGEGCPANGELSGDLTLTSGGESVEIV